VYVVATFGMVLLGMRANRLSQANIKTLVELEQEKSRPLVDVEIITESAMISLKVTNRGLTPAYDIRLSITPPLKLLFERQGEDDQIGILKHGIGSLAPGGSVVSLFGAFYRVKETNPDLYYKGIVTFHNAAGRQYELPVSLDLRYIENNHHIDRKTIHDVAKQLEEFQKEFHSVATGFHKPFVITQDAKEKAAEDTERHEQFLAMVKEKKNKTGAGIAVEKSEDEALNHLKEAKS
jgi:hypothetical protein